jgi:carbon monoxide dehydrogenase subunit G
MLHFEGDRDFAQPPPVMFAKLRDARFLARCIPGAEAVPRADADEALCTIRPGFAFVRGTLEVTLSVLEVVEPSAVRLKVVSKGVGSTSEVAANLGLAPSDSGTRVHWTADITSLGGLLKAVPQGLIRGAADKVIQDVWSSVTARLSE